MSPSDLTIRTAGSADLPALLDLYQHLNPGDERPTGPQAEAALERLMRYEGSAIFLALSDATPAASCTLVVIPNLTRGGAPYGLVENVVTHAAYRNRGIGQRLMDHATEAAWQAGCYKLMLMTGSTQPETLGFYQRAGFEQSKTGFQKRRIAPRPE